MEYKRILPHILDRSPVSQAVAGICRLPPGHTGHCYRVLPLISLCIENNNLMFFRFLFFRLLPAGILILTADPASHAFCQMKGCLCAGFKYFLIFPVRLFIDRPDGASGNNVMELV